VSDGIKLEPFCIQCTEIIILTGNVSRSSKPIFNKEFRLKFNKNTIFRVSFDALLVSAEFQMESLTTVILYFTTNLRPSMCRTRGSI